MKSSANGRRNFQERRFRKRLPSPTWRSNTNRSGALMLVLDENLPDGLQQLLRRARIRFRVMVIEVGASGTQDDNLIPVLHRLARPTFFSFDRDFCRPVWANPNYCLVWLD